MARFVKNGRMLDLAEAELKSGAFPIRVFELLPVANCLEELHEIVMKLHEIVSNSVKK